MNLRTLFLALLLIVIGSHARAQAVTNYTFSASSGTYTALSGGTSPTLSSGGIDDGWFDNLPIGFDFWYMGTRYTTVSMSTNGWLTLGASISNNASTNALSTGGNPRPVIAPLWDNLDPQVSTNVSYLTSGSAGSRIFTLECLNMQWGYAATGNTISFQVKLTESTGKIDFVYRPEAGTVSSPSASIGITATATGSGNFLSLNGTGTAPTASSTTETATLSTKPASGQTYTFTPPVPTTPTSLSFTSVTTSTMTLNWTDNASNEVGYVIYKSTDGTNYTFLEQKAANSTSAAQTGLAPATTYYWKIYAVTEGGLGTALSGSQSTTSAAWYNASWLYRKVITIDYTKVGTGPHASFPMLISTADADLLADAQTDGDDILFTSADGTTKLDHQIETYTSASGTIIAWVEIPSLSSTANTVIYMYYGNAAAASQQNATGTWDANYKGVWHLNAAFTDATSNANNGTNTGTTNATGKISNGRGFVRSDGSDYIQVTGLMGSPTSFTLSAWATLTTTDPNGAEIISLGDNALLRYDEVSANKTCGVAYQGSTTWNTTASGINYAGTGWHYIVYTFDDAGNSQKVYVDGAQVATAAFTPTPVYTSGGTNTFIGKHGNGNANMDFDGTIDEARVSNSVRSAGWVLTEYNNQNSPSTFYSVGSEVSNAKVFTGTGNFSTAARWTGGTLPIAGENLIIDGACTVDNSVTTDNVAYGTIIIGTGTGRTLDWASSGTNRLNVTDVSAGVAASTLNMTNGGTLIIRGTWTSTNLTFTPGAGTIDVRSSMTLPAAYATYNHLIINGSATTVSPGVNTTLNGNLTVTSGTFSVGAYSLAIAGTATVASTFTITSATGAKSFGNLTISSGGTFTNTTANVPISIAGNLQNDGTLSQGTGRVTFTGATSNTVTGSSTTAFGGGITVNKGTANTNVLDIQSLITMSSGGLTLTNGTFKLSSASTITPFTSNIGTAPYLIPSTAALWCNGGTMTATNMPVNFAGLIRVSAGSLGMGTIVGNYVSPVAGANIIVEGGSFTTADRISTVGSAWTFSMTGGTLTVGDAGCNTIDRPLFNMDVTGCSFSMSGGTMIVARPGGNPGQNLGFRNLATGGSGFTGGTLQMGYASTPAASIMGITSTNPIYNLTVNCANSTAQVQTSALTVTNNLTISSGTLDANNLNITVGKDWSNSGTFTAGTANVTFNAGNNQTITHAGSGDFYNLTVDKTANAVALASNITVTHTLALTARPLDLNTHTLTISRADSAALTFAAGYILSEQINNSSMVAWAIGADTTTHIIPFGTITGVSIPVRIKCTAGDLSTVMVSTYPTNVANMPYPATPTLVSNMNNSAGVDNSLNVVDRFWQLTPIEMNGSATMTFTSQASEVGSVANMLAQRFDGITNTWEAPLPNQSRSGTTVTVSGASAIQGPWALVGGNSPLPVEFFAFDAYTLGENVEVRWTTASETNSDYFAVQRSQDGTTFETVATVEAAGSSNVLTPYHLSDSAPFQGSSYYRVVEVDNAGSTTTSEMVEVSFDQELQITVTSYPNPTTQDHVQVSIQDAGGKTVDLILSNLMGVVLSHERVAIEGNAFTYTLHPQQPLAAGTYLLQATIGASTYNQRVSIQK